MIFHSDSTFNETHGDFFDYTEARCLLNLREYTPALELIRKVVSDLQRRENFADAIMASDFTNMAAMTPQFRDHADFRMRTARQIGYMCLLGLGREEEAREMLAGFPVPDGF
jgi:hypothetical protein